MFNVPILILGYVRYDTLKQQLESLKKIKPSKLYYSFDGVTNETDKAKREKCVQLIKNTDFENCEIKYYINDKHLGCTYGIKHYIDWFFENEEMGIILEDDIVPMQSFYAYCEELLLKYKNNKEIGAISGWGYFYKEPLKNYNYSYYFSIIQSSWGWATWRDRWNDMDIDLINTKWENIKINLEQRNIPEPIINYYQYIYNNCKYMNTWDYQFLLSVMFNYKRLCIQPLKRLVKNIGNTDDSAHSSSKESDLNRSEEFGKDFKLIHPEVINYDVNLDIIRNYQTNEYVGDIMKYLQKI